jgi:hypothetical protein
MDANEEFLKAFESIKPNEYKEEYRAYYDDDGWILFFTGSGFPEGDNWVNIERELYITGDWQYLKLVDGKIVKILPNYNHYFPLTKSTKGAKVVKNHAGIILDPSEEYTDIEYYDKSNN